MFKTNVTNFKLTRKRRANRNLQNLTKVIGKYKPINLSAVFIPAPNGYYISEVPFVVLNKDGTEYIDSYYAGSMKPISDEKEIEPQIMHKES